MMLLDQVWCRLRINDLFVNQQSLVTLTKADLVERKEKELELDWKEKRKRREAVEITELGTFYLLIFYFNFFIQV